MDITLNLTNGNQETHKNAKFEAFGHHWITFSPRSGPMKGEKISVNLKAYSVQRSDLTPEEISSHLLPPAPPRAPEDLWAELQRTGAIPASMALQDLAAPRPAGSPSRILVELAPLEDGVNPVELLIYLPDAIRTCAAALVGIQGEMRELTKAVREASS